METITATTPAVPRPKAKGILSLFSSDNNRGEGDDAPEYLTYHPYDEIVLRQNDVLLRRHRTKKQPHTSPPPPPLSYDALSCATAGASTTTQESLDDLLVNTDLVLLFFAEARGCAHSNRVRTMVSHFLSSHHHKDNPNVASATADMGDASFTSSAPSCCCICILNGAPDESIDWKKTFLEGTGFHVWPPVAAVAALPSDDRNTNSSLVGEEEDESLLFPTEHHAAPPPDHRRSAIIQN